MARYFGNKTAVYAGITAPTPGAGNKVGDIKDFSLPQTPTTADRTSNDTGMREAHGVVRYTGDASFKIAALNRADPGQAILIAAIDVDSPGTGTGMLFFEVHPEGTASGRPKITFEASVDLKVAENLNEWASADVTLKISGAVTRGTQA